MTNKELIELLEGDETRVVILAKKKKTGGYTVFPRVEEVFSSLVPFYGNCQIIVFES